MIIMAWAVVIVMAFFILIPLIGVVVGGETYGESMLNGFFVCCFIAVPTLIAVSGGWAISTIIEHYAVTLR